MLRTCHLFAGAGGGLLADLILGHTPVVAVEWDAYACQILRERAADGWFPGLHVWEGDVRLFDPSEYAGSVDCIHAGFPCQDISVAGKQAGVGTETRSGLYREALRIAGVVRPRFLFLENVAAIVTNGLGTVLADLAALGYDSEWLCLRASDCGANHYRDRWWLFADSGSQAIAKRNNERTEYQPQNGPKVRPINSPIREDVADSDSSISQTRRTYRLGENQSPETLACNGRNDVAHADSTQREGMRSPVRIGTEYTDPCSPGWWEIEPNVGRVADGIPNRVHQLKGLGNAQVPLQAAVAWRLLSGQ